MSNIWYIMSNNRALASEIADYIQSYMTEIGPVRMKYFS